MTFDGHLAEDLKCFYLSSNNLSTLNEFRKLVQNKFGISGRLESNIDYSNSYKYRIFNRKICKFLESVGVPKGNKVKKSFLVPIWIVEDTECSREYLRTAFDCEGSIWFEKQPKIRFGVAKSKELLPNAIEFLDQMKSMLSCFNIGCTKTWITKANLRKDGIVTKALYFKLTQASIPLYAKYIGFSDTFKNGRLILTSTLGHV